MISIIVPCYNEQEALPLFYEEATKVLKTLNMDYEILLVNDGSRDQTLSEMKLLAEKDEHVNLPVVFPKLRKEAAMYAAFATPEEIMWQ